MAAVWSIFHDMLRQYYPREFRLFRQGLEAGQLSSSAEVRRMYKVAKLPFFHHYKVGDLSKSIYF